MEKLRVLKEGAQVILETLQKKNKAYFAAEVLKPSVAFVVDLTKRGSLHYYCFEKALLEPFHP